MELLRISRSTLNRLRWENKIKVNKLPNGYYDYDEKSIYEYLLKTTGKPVKRKTVLYKTAAGRPAPFRGRDESGGFLSRSLVFQQTI